MRLASCIGWILATVTFLGACIMAMVVGEWEDVSDFAEKCMIALGLVHLHYIGARVDQTRASIAKAADQFIKQIENR